MAAVQARYGMNTVEEAADDTQYNAVVTQFTSGHAAAQGIIVNLTATNATQHHQIAALHLQVTQSANTVGQVTHCPHVQQPMMQMHIPMQYQQ